MCQILFILGIFWFTPNNIVKQSMNITVLWGHKLNCWLHEACGLLWVAWHRTRRDHWLSLSSRKSCRCRQLKAQLQGSVWSSPDPGSDWSFADAQGRSPAAPLKRKPCWEVGRASLLDHSHGTGVGLCWQLSESRRSVRKACVFQVSWWGRASLRETENLVWDYTACVGARI